MDETPLSMCIPPNASITVSTPGAEQDYKRKPNFSDAEKIFLIEQYSVFKESLSSRLADVSTVRKKQEIWTFIASELNRYNPTVERTAKETRKKWENLTSMARKEMAEFRSGCLKGKSPSAITLRVLEVIDDIVFTPQNIKIEDIHDQNSDDSTLNDGMTFNSRNEHTEIDHSGVNFQPTMANLIFSANSPSLAGCNAAIDSQSPLPVSSSNGHPNMPPLPKLTMGQQNLYQMRNGYSQKRPYQQQNSDNIIAYSNKRKFVGRMEQQCTIGENGRTLSFKKRKRHLELERLELENEKLRLEIELLRGKLKDERHQDDKQDEQSHNTDQID